MYPGRGGMLGWKGGGRMDRGIKMQTDTEPEGPSGAYRTGSTVIQTVVGPAERQGRYHPHYLVTGQRGTLNRQDAK